MANTYTSLGGLFTAIANAIRAKKGTTDTIVADNFPSEIESIASQPSLQTKTVSPSTAAQTITPDSGYDGLSQVVVNAISPTKGAQTYTPTTTNQTISSGRWLTGAQTIKGDANLVASNIKSGVSIFGVSGSYSPSAVIPTKQIRLQNNSSYDIDVSYVNSSGVWTSFTLRSNRRKTISVAKNANGCEEFIAEIKGESNPPSVELRNDGGINFGTFELYTRYYFVLWFVDGLDMEPSDTYTFEDR